MIDGYLHQLTKPSSERVRMGAASALGSMPRGILCGHLDRVLSALIQGTEIRENEKNWAEARRDSFKAIEK